MSRLYVLATGPLLAAGAKVMSGQCLRTWHFVKPLLDDGHEVTLCTIPIPGTLKDSPEELSEPLEYEGFVYTNFLANDSNLILPAIQAQLDDNKYDAILGINAYPAYLAALLNSKLPMWADLNGWTMVEGQTRAAIVGHDEDFHHFWKTEMAVLQRADRFSTVTDRQGYALYGELAVSGRLTRDNYGGGFVCTVPNAVHPVYTTVKRSRELPKDLLPEISPEALVVYWSGGFNTWTDVDLLVEALRLAMEREERLVFVATGGAVLGHDEKTYEQFLKLASSHLDSSRVHLLGWTDFDKVLLLHGRADVGINIDGRNTETIFGARNRLTNMMGCGMPVVTTVGTEVAEWISTQDAGLVAESDGEALADAIILAAREHSSDPDRCDRIRTMALETFAPRATVGPLLDWVRAPGTSNTSEGNDPASRLRRWMGEQARLPEPFHPEPTQPQGTLSRVKRKLKTIIKGQQ